MPTKEIQTSVVAVGLWNAAVLSPEWLQKQGVIKEAPENVNVSISGQANTVSFVADEFEWSMNHSKLVVKSPNKFDDCGRALALVLGLLPHTPISAIGSNFEILSSKSDWTKFPLSNEEEFSIPNWTEIKWTASRKLDENTRLQVTLTEAETLADQVAVAINLHRNVTSAEQAREFALAWLQDKDSAMGLMKEMFGIDFQ